MQPENERYDSYGSRIHMKVLPGNRTDWSVHPPLTRHHHLTILLHSIPPSHRRLISEIPPFLQECEPAVFKVSSNGGELSGFVRAVLPHTNEVRTSIIRSFTKDEYVWIPDYPVSQGGVTIKIFVRVLLPSASKLLTNVATTGDGGERAPSRGSVRLPHD